MTTLRILETDRTFTDAEAHLLPCTVAFNGTSDVSSYFVVQKDGDKAKAASFRGRELRGVPVGEISEGLGGHVYRYEQREAGDKEWTSAGKLQSFTHWSYDADPEVQSMGVRKLLGEWPGVSAALADEVTEEEVLKAAEVTPG
eukprot:Sspe_Gene.55903::Locus_30750_Transcript_1_1_Confidence_1.000_Length_591::g.55903::m.55903/K10745/RNASEH2C; ribonuclease H2 subunit C